MASLFKTHLNKAPREQTPSWVCFVFAYLIIGGAPMGFKSPPIVVLFGMA